MQLKEFVEKYGLESCSNRVDKDFLYEVKKKLGVAINSQLEDYLLKYGHLAYGHIEFLGMNSKQLWDSDMIATSVRLHKKFEKTQGLLAIYNNGDGDYYLVDGIGFVHRFVAMNNMLFPVNQDLNTFIVSFFGLKVFKYTCTKCIHYESCNDWAGIIFGEGTTFPYHSENKPCDFYKEEGEYELEVVKRFVKTLKKPQNRFRQENGQPVEYISAKDINSAVEALQKKTNTYSEVKIKEKHTE